MSKDSTLTEQTKRIFKETVAIYRKDLDAMVKNPLPLIIVIAALVVFWLAVRWL